MSKELTSKHKALLTLGALILIFVGPMIAAWSLYTSHEPVLQTVNYGDLVQPPLQFSNLSLYQSDNTAFKKTVLRKEWVLIYVSPVSCAKLCAQNLYKMRQLHLALGKDQERLQRLLLTYPGSVDPDMDNQLRQDYKGTYHAVVKPNGIKLFLPGSLMSAMTSQQGALFLVDPLGNMMMHYPPDADPEKMLKDITRLLRISQIG